MKGRTIRGGRGIATLGLLLLVTACATPLQKADDYIAQDEWLKAVIEYRKAHTANPRDVEYKSRLKQIELKAADFYYQRGMNLLDQSNLDGAIVQFQQGLAAMPDHSKLQQAMGVALAKKEANALYQEAVRMQESGNAEDAKRLYQQALQAYPDHKAAADAYVQLQRQLAEIQDPDKLALTSKAPITLNFRQTDLKTAFEFIAKSFGVNVIFDEGIKSVPVTLFAQDVTFEQALNLLFTTHKAFYKKIGPNTILIIPDTKEKRGQYEDHIVRTYQLNNVKAKDMAEILKGILTVKKIIINDELNFLVVRDTEDVLKLVEKVIDTNDKKPAEMILEVEILEVNRSKAEQLGLDLGTYRVSATMPGEGIPLGGSIINSVKTQGILFLPSATFRFYKQDVDAKTLANPKVRVLNGKAAKIHVGERVPLQGQTITDPTGQVRVTYEYKEIGIKLTAEPQIHIDNSATVKLGLEVSSLGENLGTKENPAYRIGTRNAETFMLLRDGETAILGGLIRDEDRSQKVRIPGLGDIPIIGSLFASYDDSSSRTDVLLTITPRVVRGWDAPPKEARQFFSGTADSYSTQALFAAVSAPAVPTKKLSSERDEQAKKVVDRQPLAGLPPVTGTPTVDGTVPAPVAGSATPAQAAASAAPSVAPAEPAPVSGPPVLAFAAPVYEIPVEQETVVQMMVENIDGVATMPLEILFNPQLLTFVRGEAGDFAVRNFKAEVDEGKGTLKVGIEFDATALPKGKGALAKIVLRGAKPGISYLVYRMPSLVNASGGSVSAQVRASRVVVK